MSDDPHNATSLAAVAARVTAQVMPVLRRQMRQALAAPQLQHALAGCFQAALEVWLPADDPLSQRYASVLEPLWDEPAVLAELAKLVSGRTPDQETLVEGCAECTAGSDLPPFPLVARLEASVAAFHRAAALAPELSARLAVTRGPDVPPSQQAGTGNITAGEAIHAENLITGTQINHIVQIYQAARGDAWDEAAYRRALGRYLSWLAEAMGRVVLRGIQRQGQQAVELALDAIYVPLQAEALPAAEEALKRGLRQAGRSPGRAAEAPPSEMLDTAAAARRITMRELLAQGQRVALIGAPGCGKTTVLQHLAWTLAEALRTRQPELAAARLGLTGELPLPINVPLSSYAEHRRRFADAADPRQRLLPTFFSHYLQERHADLHLPQDFFATLLTQGRHVILLLDGLDEVPSEDERVLVSQIVRDLTHTYRHLRLVVTSRTRAYQGRAALGGDFRVVQVLPLEPEAVATLIEQAYRAIYPAAIERHERDRQAADLVAGVRQLEAERATRLGGGDDSRLVTTPLLVRMLLIVHFNLRRLPAQRAELYMEVVDTLLTSDYNPDAAVAQRLARLGGDWRTRRDLLQYLAFVMHSQGQQAGREMGERQLTDVLQTYLQDRRDTSPHDARELVADLVAVIRQRGGVLEERDGQYRFGHLSLQEFLTARYLAEVEREVSRIATFLEHEQRVADSWWREVVLLTGGYLHVTASETATELLRRLAQGATAGSPRTAGALSAAELAATVFLEWGGPETTRTALASRLVALLTDPDLTAAPPPLRAAAGRVLALLGDPREGVGTPENVPQLAWCTVPGGPFRLGANRTEETFGDEQQHPLTLPTFYLARYPITNAQFAPFVEAGGYDQEHWWTRAGWAWRHGAEPDLTSIAEESTRQLYAEIVARRPRERRGEPFYWQDERWNLPNHPVIGVSWYEAMAYCAWLHRQLTENGPSCVLDGVPLETLLASGTWQLRLPTEAEWEKAAAWDAAGQRKRVYAWGDPWDATKANVDRQIGRSSAVGIFPAGASPCGALDMTGNVWEWTWSRYMDYPYQNDTRHDPEGEASRTLRGGGWDDDARNARASYRAPNHPAVGVVYVGLRVAVAPVLWPSGS